ncbi:MAG: SIS domain-containing protein [Rickettsiaceae bacterium]
MKHIEIAKRVIQEESNALQILSKNIPKSFDEVIDYILQLEGSVIMTGLGKSGYAAQKISKSLSSTGTIAFYVHPTEASHGDLGMITSKDMVIMISNSGETQELLSILHYCRKFNIKTAIITMNPVSILADQSDFLLNIPQTQEASSIGAPTTSVLLALSIGDAISIALQEAKNFKKNDFHTYHPGGWIGRNAFSNHKS